MCQFNQSTLCTDLISRIYSVAEFSLTRNSNINKQKYSIFHMFNSSTYNHIHTSVAEILLL